MFIAPGFLLFQKTFFGFFFYLWWPLLSVFNTHFDCLDQINTLNDDIKWVFNVVKRNTDIKRHTLCGLVPILKHTTATAPLFDCPICVNT